MFILPGVGCWFVDACFRFYRGLRAVRVLGARVLELGKAGRITELRLEAPFQFSPGHYLFINVAQVSVSQWHPFTISSAGPDITLHIKDMGPGTWTNQLASLVAAASDSISAASPRATHATDHSNIASLGLTVSLDGPCGLPIDFTQYESVILVAGGIGITPCKSIFEALQHNARHGCSLGALRHVHLLWVARDRRLFSELMSRSLELPPPPQAAGIEFSAHLFTDDPDEATTETGLRPVSLLGPEAWSRLVENGRPDLATELAAVPKPADPARTIVFVCGPPGVASAVESIAFHHSWAFHTELFYL
jgi:NAD(P)H-flavin reductase